jgi:hypothetical protein
MGLLIKDDKFLLGKITTINLIHPSQKKVLLLKMLKLC